jgi:murein L,D-transpeptidase YcbB/YkuD
MNLLDHETPDEDLTEGMQNWVLKLIHEGYFTDAMPSKFNEQTKKQIEEATKKFQKANGLKPDTVIGAKTLTFVRNEATLKIINDRIEVSAASEAV